MVPWAHTAGPGARAQGLGPAPSLHPITEWGREGEVGMCVARQGGVERYELLYQFIEIFSGIVF